MIRAPVPQVNGFFFLRLGGAWRCVVADKAAFPAANDSAFRFLLSIVCVCCIGVGSVPRIFPLVFVPPGMIRLSFLLLLLRSLHDDGLLGCFAFLGEGLPAPACCFFRVPLELVRTVTPAVEGTLGLFTLLDHSNIATLILVSLSEKSS